jgi:HNH endonuclease
LVRHYRDLTTDPDAPAPQDSLRGWFDDQGRYRLSGSMCPLDGATVDAALDAARDRDLADRGATPGETLSDAEALTRVAEAYLADTTTGAGVIPQRFHTMVLLDGDGASLAGGPHLDASLAHEVLCSSWLSALTSKDGQPLTTTSRTRLATPAQQRALLARDRCCAYPGCGRTRHLRAHHLVHHAHGGPTRLDNMALVCPRHHRVIHQPGWTTQRDPTTGHLVITDPHGHRLSPPAPRSPLSDDDAPPECESQPVPPLRRPPAGDPLTDYGRDVILHHWLEPPAA